MVPELPHELILIIFELSLVDGDLSVGKALRLLNREFALRFSRPVWFVGAQTHYFNYLLRLSTYERRVTINLLCDATGGYSVRRSIRRAATNAARATSAAIEEDSRLFKQLSKCTKFRI